MALASLLKLIPVSQVVFGTDYGFSAGDLRAIERENALRLLPRLKA
jgi:hypothetical protein